MPVRDSSPHRTELVPPGIRGAMLRKRYYILFVARDHEGHLRKIPVPLRYAYGFLAAAIVGAFTIVGLAGSYTRMLLKTESYNQVRAERETLRQNYLRMEQIAQTRSVQVASLGALANEVSAQLLMHFGEKVFRTVIPRNIRLAEAPSFGRPVLLHDKDSRGALAYLALAGEMIRRDEVRLDPAGMPEPDPLPAAAADGTDEAS